MGLWLVAQMQFQSWRRHCRLILRNMRLFGAWEMLILLVHFLIRTRTRQIVVLIKRLSIFSKLLTRYFTCQISKKLYACCQSMSLFFQLGCMMSIFFYFLQDPGNEVYRKSLEVAAKVLSNTWSDENAFLLLLKSCIGILSCGSVGDWQLEPWFLLVSKSSVVSAVFLRSQLYFIVSLELCFSYHCIWI